MWSGRKIKCAASLLSGFAGFALLAGAELAFFGHPGMAAPLGPALIVPAANETAYLVEARARGGFRGGGMAYRGGGFARRGGAAGFRGGAVWRGGGAAWRRGGAVAWRRPGGDWWPAGGAIAAGAALGVLSAATAAAWAGAAPAPGYCWYYTDPSRRQGFWDVCR